MKIVLVDERKIIIMTKLAIYDKQLGKLDRRSTELFRHDFIYQKNAYTRFCVFLGTLIVLSVTWLHKIFVVGVDLFELDYQAELTKMVWDIIIVLLVYTVISTIKATWEYTAAELRLKRYFNLLGYLERYNARHTYEKSEGASRYGANFANKRNYDQTH